MLDIVLGEGACVERLRSHIEVLRFQELTFLTNALNTLHDRYEGVEMPACTATREDDLHTGILAPKTGFSKTMEVISYSGVGRC
jgi:predicted alpha/beta hydrolase